MRGSDYEVIIPQVTIGEAFAKVLTKAEDIDQNTHQLANLILNIISQPQQCIPVPTEAIYQTALEVINHDNQLDLCDALISAHALNDTEARFLVTTDTKIHVSSYIQNKIEMSHSQLRIIESI